MAWDVLSRDVLSYILLRFMTKRVASDQNASMTFRRKPFRRMRLSVESDITSNATIRRIFVERQLVEWTYVEISSKIRRNFVEK